MDLLYNPRDTHLFTHLSSAIFGEWNDTMPYTTKEGAILEATKEKMVPRNGGSLSAPGLPSRIGQARNIYIYTVKVDGAHGAS